MKHLPNVVGALLGFLFVASGLVVLLKLGPTPPAPPEGSAAAQFMAAMAPTGYLSFVKVVEVIGGILVAIPRARNFGLLALGPVVINIIAFHAFILKGEGLFTAPILIMSAMAAYLLWSGRKEFAGLLR